MNGVSQLSLPMPNKPCAWVTVDHILYPRRADTCTACSPPTRRSRVDGTQRLGVADQRAVLRATGDIVEPVTLTERCRMRNCWKSLCLNLSPPEWRVKNDNFPIIGRKSGRAEFIEYDEVGAGK